MEQGLEALEEGKDEGVHEPQLPIKTGMAALSRALKRKEADVLEAEQSLEGAKHWKEEAIKKVATDEERLAVLRAEQRKCAEQYQQAALESSSEVLGGPLWECWQVLSELPQRLLTSWRQRSLRRCKDCSFLSRSSWVKGPRELLRRSKKQEAADAAAKAKEDGADSAAAGTSARVKRPRREEGDEQPDMDVFDAEQAVAAGMGPELLAKLPPGAKEVMAHLIEQYRSSPESGSPAGP